jgi:hypothetical protein
MPIRTNIVDEISSSNQMNDNEHDATNRIMVDENEIDYLQCMNLLSKELNQIPHIRGSIGLQHVDSVTSSDDDVPEYKMLPSSPPNTLSAHETFLKNSLDVTDEQMTDMTKIEVVVASSHACACTDY